MVKPHTVGEADSSPLFMVCHLYTTAPPQSSERAYPVHIPATEKSRVIFVLEATFPAKILSLWRRGWWTLENNYCEVHWGLEGWVGLRWWFWTSNPSAKGRRDGQGKQAGVCDYELGGTFRAPLHILRNEVVGNGSWNKRTKACISIGAYIRFDRLWKASRVA